MRRASYACAVVFVGIFAGCGSTAVPAGCPEGNEIRGACAGVPQAAVCDGDTCVEGVACKVTIPAASDAELQSAASSAMSGACIVLSPGSYGDVTLPGGVSLLGRSAAEVTVGKVALEAGESAVIRGFKTSGVHVKGATGVKVESVQVAGSADTGVLVDAQSSVSLVTTTIEASALYGLYAVDSLGVSLDRVLISGSGAPGLWIASSSACPSPGAEVAVSASSSIVRGNHVVGVALFGAKATMRGVDILATLPGDAVQYGQFGGGLAAASCSDLDLRGLRVNDNKSFGVLVDGSKGRIGDTGPGEEIEIHRNVIGISIQGIQEGFELESAQLDQNQGTGINVSGESHGVIICRTGVTKTQKRLLATTGGDLEQVGHGLVWADGSSVTVTQVSMGGNAVASVLIDGAASGTLDQVKLSDGDEALGIVQQNFAGGAQPVITGGTPTPQTAAGEVHPVPAPLTIVPKSL